MGEEEKRGGEGCEPDGSGIHGREWGLAVGFWEEGREGARMNKYTWPLYHKNQQPFLGVTLGRATARSFSSVISSLQGLSFFEPCRNICIYSAIYKFLPTCLRGPYPPT